MGRHIVIRKHRHDGAKVLYYFTDYVPPVSKISNPISNCVEGFMQIDLNRKTSDIIESTSGVMDGPKAWIIEKVLALGERAMKSGQFPDIMDYNS